MKIIISLILSAFLLTSCSNPDTSGGVTLSRGGDDGNEFPYGDCRSQGRKSYSSERTGCGWIRTSWYDEENYYIMPNADLSGANLRQVDLYGANLIGANLRHADLYGAKLGSVKADSRTICPNGKTWGTAGNNCGFSGSDKEFPYGSCWGQGENPPGGKTGCGWIRPKYSGSHYIMPGVNLSWANLTDVNLRGAELERADLYYADLWGADLTGADLRGANLSQVRVTQAILTGVKLDKWTTCPNDQKWRKGVYECGEFRASAAHGPPAAY